jgi:hypothetical protein
MRKRSYGWQRGSLAPVPLKLCVLGNPLGDRRWPATLPCAHIDSGYVPSWKQDREDYAFNTAFSHLL